MKIQIIKTRFINSIKDDGRYYDVLFYCFDDERYRRSCIYPKFRNFKNWKNIDVAGTVYSGARIKRVGNAEMIDADSVITYVGNEPLPQPKKKKSNQIKLFN